MKYYKLLTALLLTLVPAAGLLATDLTLRYQQPS